MLALGATAAVVVGGIVIAPAAQAATTWQAFDKNCKTVIGFGGATAGSACAEVQKRVTDTGSITGYRARLTVAPAEGHSLKPTTHTWSSDGATNPICSGGCAPQTSAWTSAWTPVKTTAGSYIARGEISGGYVFDVAASWSEWTRIAGKCATYTAGKICAYRHERAYRDTYQERGKLTVTPSAGNWLEPRWVRVGIVSDGTDTHKTRDLCATSCTRRTAYWSTTVSRTVPGIGGTYQLYASAQVALPNGDVKTIKASVSG
ncbi:hypothetical protein [Lentzea sp. E54]|uniref:hypothetical protein n=1 Tax=Lentzea xerophila TaxID=3435883 RepID=UPI003DA3623D